MPPGGEEEIDLLASARWLARHFIHRYNVPPWVQHEVYGDARLTVAQLAQTHDPAKSSWTSYLFRQGLWRLVDIMRERSGQRSTNQARLMPVPLDDDKLHRLIPAQRDASEDVVERLTLQSQMRDVFRACRMLSENERHVIARYYLDGLLLREIAEEMGLTESRICQLHRAALRKLRFRLTA